MVFTVTAVPISDDPLFASITAKGRNGKHFLSVEKWTATRSFLAKSMIHGRMFFAIEVDLHRDHPQVFDIDTSDSALEAAGFIPVQQPD